MHRICGIIDFDGFKVLGRFFVREFGYIGIDWRRGGSKRYDLSHYYDRLSSKDLRTVRYVENHIFGMPFNPMHGETVYRLRDLNDHLENFYENCRTRDCYLIAYKGGHYEKDRLDSLDIPSVNLEHYGCPTYDRLQCARYDRIACNYHTRNLHCPRAEVTAFKEWVIENV